MADHTGIEWTDATWNPIVGCSLASPGCTHCYAMAQAARIERMQPGSHYAGTTQPSKAGAVWTGRMALAPEHILTQPLRWRRPRRIFVNSMGDLFHEDVPDEWIDRVFAIMALTPHHTYQVLTKRSARMREYMAAWPMDSREPDRITNLAHEIAWGMRGYSGSGGLAERPLPNVWLGVSTEDQRRADERGPDLLASPAAVRFVSAEPLLGPIDFERIKITETDAATGNKINIVDPLDAFKGMTWTTPLRGEHAGKRFYSGSTSPRPGKLDLVIVGGESGPNARPMHPDWVRSLRDQCGAAGTAFFFKQWGAWAPRGWKADGGTHAMRHTAPDWGCFQEIQSHPDSIERVEPAPDGWQAFAHVGKHAAGRLLDGVEHNAMPEVRA